MCLLLRQLLVLLLPRVLFGDDDEYRLYDDLRKDYYALERPVANHSHPLRTKLGLLLQQIINVDEKNQVMEVNGWIRLSWTDYKLRWEPNLYGGVKDVCN